MFDRIKTLIIKEFIAILQDKKARIILVLPPIMQLFIFTFAATLDVQNVTMGVLNKDYGQLSFELIQRIKGSPYFKEVIALRSDEELQEMIDQQKVLLAIQMDDTFTSFIYKGEQAALQVTLDGRKSNSSQIAQGYISKIVDRFNKDVALELGFSGSKGQIIPRNWFNQNLIYPWFTLSGLIGVLTMLTTLSVTAMAIAREREMGTFEQLLVTPLSSTEVLLGKAIPGVIIGVVEGTGMLIAGKIVVGIPIEGSLLAFYCGMSVFVLAIVGVGLFISSLSMTQQQASLGVFAFMSPAVILSGFATPIENMPTWLQPVTNLNPLKFFLNIVRGVLFKDIGWDVVLQNIVPMSLIAFATLGVSVLFFRKQVEVD